MVNYVPIGSVVLLKGGSRKVIIIGRALNVENNGKKFFFDYGGVPYPEGLTGDQLAYFNNDDIAKVVFEGYKDVDDENVVKNINRYLEEHPDINRGSVEAWNNEKA